MAVLLHRWAWPLLLADTLIAVPAGAQDVPPTLAELLREATPQERETIENVAKRLYPDARAQIDNTVDLIEDEEKARVGEARFVEGWSGEGSLGASLSSGNTDQSSLSASMNVQRKGPRWQHNFALDGAIRISDGERIEQRLDTSYRLRRDFLRTPWFAFALVRFEHDRQQALDQRFTETAGIGHQILDTKRHKWEVSAGPALRQTQFDNGTSEKELAGFVGTEIKWDITDTLIFREQLGLVLDAGTTSIGSTTSITSNIYGRLSGRLSLEVMSESSPPPGSEQVDTYTTFSLVLSL